MRRIVGIGFLLPAVLLLTAGCATKNWVREVLGQKEGEIGQRIGKVEGQVVKVGDQIVRVEDQVDSRVKTVEASVGQAGDAARAAGDTAKVAGDTARAAGDTARSAQDRAETALAKAGSVDSRLTRLWSNRHNMKVADVVEIPFAFDRWDLGDSAQTTLLRVVQELQENPGLTVELAGYTDTQGAREYNYQLSQRRVDAVRRFLVQKGVLLARIQAIGLGAIADPGVPEEKKRRVTVKLLVDQD